MQMNLVISVPVYVLSPWIQGHPSTDSDLIIKMNIVLLGHMNCMMSSNGNIFHITGPWCSKFTGDRWIYLIKAIDA